jgi:hypothetical protein
MKYCTLTILLSLMINIVSTEAQQSKQTEKQLRKKEERSARMVKANNKINKKIRDIETKRQRDILAKQIETHEIRVNRRNKAREERIIREHIAEYKRKSDQDDKITKRKTKRADRKFDNEHAQLVKVNKKSFGTKESRNNFRTDHIENNGTAMNSGAAKKKPRNSIATR